MPLYFPAQGDSSKCQESCSMWLLESHHVVSWVLGSFLFNCWVVCTLFQELFLISCNLSFCFRILIEYSCCFSFAPSVCGKVYGTHNSYEYGCSFGMALSFLEFTLSFLSLVTICVVSFNFWIMSSFVLVMLFHICHYF